MLGTKQKECLIQGLSRSIRMIRIKEIKSPYEIQYIVETAMSLRQDKTIADFKEIGTTALELLSFLHQSNPDQKGH